MKRTGILAAGNWIIDHIKTIDAWPAQETLSNILRQERANGGSPFNLLVDLAKLGAAFPLQGCGLVGSDEDGEAVLSFCREHSIDTSQIRTTGKVSTSYTDVMSVAGSGRRTFFHQRGANALFGPEHLDLSASTARMFHLGYLMLLDKFDAKGIQHATVAADVLSAASEKGFFTSIDLVTTGSEHFSKTICAALPHVDLCFMNELEAQMVTHLTIRDADGKLQRDQLMQAGAKILRLGLRGFLVVHFPEGAVAFRRGEEPVCVTSIPLKPGEIIGTVGAGDAFAAGVVHGFHENLPVKQCLIQGSLAAAACLRHATTSGGLRPLDQLWQEFARQ
jgi:sugar/nucleoside kinase (ribokinase family)